MIGIVFDHLRTTACRFLYESVTLAFALIYFLTFIVRNKVERTRCVSWSTGKSIVCVSHLAMLLGVTVTKKPWFRLRMGDCAYG